MVLGEFTHTECNDSPVAPLEQQLEGASAEVPAGGLPARQLEALETCTACAARDREEQALRAEVASLREHLEAMRLQWLAEQDRRLEAEIERDMAKRRVEHFERQAKMRDEKSRVSDIEAGLLQEAVIANEQARASQLSIQDVAGSALALQRSVERTSKLNTSKSWAAAAGIVHGLDRAAAGKSVVKGTAVLPFG